jgi:hypothetical protein
MSADATPSSVTSMREARRSRARRAQAAESGPALITFVASWQLHLEAANNAREHRPEPVFHSSQTCPLIPVSGYATVREFAGWPVVFRRPTVAEQAEVRHRLWDAAKAGETSQELILEASGSFSFPAGEPLLMIGRQVPTARRL